MDIRKAPVEQQAKWLQQRGWQAHPDLPNIFIEPNTRTNHFLPVALKKALEDCRIDSDTELKVDVQKRKDDAPFPLPKKSS